MILIRARQQTAVDQWMGTFTKLHPEPSSITINDFPNEGDARAGDALFITTAEIYILYINFINRI